jgi:hypothetical protein
MWIELHQGLYRHRKVARLARLLSEDARMADLALPPDVMRLVAGAHVSSLWLWCLDNAPDGDFSKLTPEEIALGAEWNGDPDLLVDALIHSGFVDRDDEVVVLHDWYDYAGKLIERRRADRERKRRQRSAFESASGRQSAQVQSETVLVPSQQTKLPIDDPSEPIQNIQKSLSGLSICGSWTSGSPKARHTKNPSTAG